MNDSCVQIPLSGRENGIILHCSRSQSLEKWLENRRRFQLSTRKWFLIIIGDCKYILLLLMRIQTKECYGGQSSLEQTFILISFEVSPELKMQQTYDCQKDITQVKETFTCLVLEMACRWLQLLIPQRQSLSIYSSSVAFLLIQNQSVLLQRLLSDSLWVIW